MMVREGKTSHLNGICSQKVGYALKNWDTLSKIEGASKEKETLYSILTTHTYIYICKALKIIIIS